ncbi:MAG: NusG domain II-containing protein [Ruminococcaceae bacterium]|nr:NusG domain II-containing protein [Oscillospiraceae bacterium]
MCAEEGNAVKKGDIAIIIIAVIFLVLWLIPKPAGDTVTITVNGEFYKSVPLNRDTEIVVESEFGKNTVIVKNGEVYVEGADCPDKLCQKDKISKNGESIVCLPNRLSVTVEGEKNKEVDVIL